MTVTPADNKMVQSGISILVIDDDSLVLDSLNYARAQSTLRTMNL